MQTIPEVRILTIQFGRMPQARALNPQFSDGHALLLATLDIAWNPGDPPSAIALLEGALLALSPRFASHQCRGVEGYHVFRRTRRSTPQAPDPPLEPALALAHLIEHAVIEFLCVICGETRCSGITAAHRNPRNRFDLLVECGDPPVGRCCLALAMTWLTLAAQGHFLGTPEMEILDTARLAHDRRLELSPPLVARTLGWPETRARRALRALSEVGYLTEIPCTVNLSGAPGYRVSRAEI